MLKRNRHTGIYLLLWATVVCVSLLSSCTHMPDASTADDADCQSVMDAMGKRLDSGAMVSRKGLYYSIRDSLAQKHHSSPLCLYLKYINYNGYYVENGSYDSSLMYADSSLNALSSPAMQKKYMNEYLFSLNRKADVLYHMNQFNQAYNYYFKAKQIADLQNDSCLRQSYNQGLAMVAYTQKKYRLATYYFEQAYKYGSYCRSVPSFNAQEALDDIALCYEKLHIYDSALFYYDSTLSFIHTHVKNNDAPVARIAIAVVEGNMGGVLLAQGKTDTAIALLKKSIAVNILPYCDNPDALLTHIKLAKAYLKKNEPTLLFTALTEIRKELDTIQHPLTAEADWKQLMYQYYERQGKPEDAILYYRGFIVIRDSLWETDKAQLQNDLTKELDENEQSYQIDLLQKQNQVNNLFLGATIGLSVLAIGVLILIYYYYSKSRKNVLALTLLNSRVEEQRRQLAQTSDDLRNSNMDKDRILHVVAHDLRNPISVIMMLGNVILEDETDNSKKDSLAMMMNAGQNSLDLISELLQFSNDAKSGHIGIKETVNLNDLVQNISGMLQFKATAKRQTFDVALSAESLTAAVNKEKINRVLGNLITNAVKFSPEGAVIHISTANKNGLALIEIKDNGIGIPHKMLPIIFDTFTTAKRRGTAGEPSFGLGLSICKQIIEAHNGRIWAESTEGNGSSFFIELPLV